MKDLVAKPVPFVLGATVVPTFVGFASRVLEDSRFLSMPALATRSIMFGGTIAGAMTTGHPFLWGAFIGQLAPTLDLLAEAAANAILRTSPRLKGLDSAESFAEGAAAGQVTDEDIAELQKLKAALVTPGMSSSWSEINRLEGASDTRRVGYQTGDIASAAVPTRFRDGSR